MLEISTFLYHQFYHHCFEVLWMFRRIGMRPRGCRFDLPPDLCLLNQALLKMTRGTNLMQKLWFIIINYLYVFRASICPSSGVQVLCYCIWCSALGVVVVVPRSVVCDAWSHIRQICLCWFQTFAVFWKFYFFLGGGDSPASEFYVPTFRNTPFHLHRWCNQKFLLTAPMKMEETVLPAYTNYEDEYNKLDFINRS
jgi:hypothetical protein